MQDAVSNLGTVILHFAVQRAERDVSLLALEFAWRAARTAEALAMANELWREEQWARKAANKDRHFGWAPDGGFLGSWADAACELRESGAVNGRYVWYHHDQDLAEQELKVARCRLRQLRKALYQSSRVD